MNNKDYQQGYAAGRKRNERRIRELEQQLAEQPDRRERIFMQSLELALKYCRGLYRNRESIRGQLNRKT